jgi:hypothetical protein
MSHQAFARGLAVFVGRKAQRFQNTRPDLVKLFVER